MSDFFDSEIVQEELSEINDLQQEIYSQFLDITQLAHEEKLEHIDKLSELLEKQKIMYARLSLSDDPTALKLKEQVKESVTLMGFPAGTDVSVLFNSMKNTIDSLRDKVDF